MKTIYLKRSFPYNYYDPRKVRVRTSSGQKYALALYETLAIEAENETWIEIKIDYHKYRLELKGFDQEEDLYVVATLKFRRTFPHNQIDLGFKNCMHAKVVSKEEFENYVDDFQIKKPKIELKVKDYIALAINILVFLTFVLLSIFSSQVEPSNQNFLFIIGLACIVGNLRFIVKREVELKAFKLTMGLTLYIALILLIIMDFDYSVESSILTVSSLAYVLTLINVQQPEVEE